MYFLPCSVSHHVTEVSANERRCYISNICSVGAMLVKSEMSSYWGQNKQVWLLQNTSNAFNSSSYYHLKGILQTLDLDQGNKW